MKQVALLVISLLVVCELLPCVAGAAPNEAAQPGASNAQYSAAIDAALEEYSLQHFEEARSLFERAHAIDPSARTLRGLGMVEFELRHYVRATELLEQALLHGNRPLTSEQRVAVTQLITRAQQFIGVYRLEIEPKDVPATVEVDGRAIELTPEKRVRLEAGEHVLQVSVHSAQPRVLRLDVKGGQQQTLPLSFAIEAEAKERPAPAKEPVRESARRPERTGPLLLGLGGGVAVVGGVLGVLAFTQADGAIEESRRAERAHGLAIGADVVIGLGAATAVVGLVLLLTRDRRATNQATRVSFERATTLTVKF